MYLKKHVEKSMLKYVKRPDLKTIPKVVESSDESETKESDHGSEASEIEDDSDF